MATKIQRCFLEGVKISLTVGVLSFSHYGLLSATALEQEDHPPAAATAKPTIHPAEIKPKFETQPSIVRRAAQKVLEEQRIEEIQEKAWSMRCWRKVGNCIRGSSALVHYSGALISLGGGI